MKTLKRRVFSFILALVMVVSICTTGMAAKATGQWKINVKEKTIAVTKEASSALKKATKKLVGKSFKPLALLGTQTVSGVNYCLLCYSKTATQNPVGGIDLVYVNKTTKGKCKIMNVVTLMSSEAGLSGGWTLTKKASKLALSKDMKKAFKAGLSNYVGITGTALGVLGSQVVAGMKYNLLCAGKMVTPGAKKNLYQITVFVGLDGKASVDSVEVIDVAALMNK
ncbi:MAG: hypothetical protein IIZ39_00415 [Blautia sp.]|nr:hypothetical protein [Blautia sp.]